MTGLSFPSFASECKRDDRPRRAFCAGAFLIAFFPGIPVLPTHGSILSRPDGCLHRFTTGRSETNLRNEPENIVRMDRVKIVTRYTQRHEAESGSLTLRLAGLLPRFPPDGLLHPAPVQLHARTSNLHGELLSVHKIKPGLTWYSKDAKKTRGFSFASLRLWNTRLSLA